MTRVPFVAAGALLGAVLTAWFTADMDAVLAGAAAGSFVAWLAHGLLQDLRDA